jgi:hypothetical protein
VERRRARRFTPGSCIGVSVRPVAAELRNLVEHVGEQRFKEAVEWAWATAAGTGSQTSSRKGDWPEAVLITPHDLEELIWDDLDATWHERVALAFALYRQMLCYATLMYARHHYSEFDQPARARFWDEMRKLLGDADDRLADPIAYSLWCDYFEDGDPVEEAWHEVAMTGPTAERRVQRVLDASGPVPFELKANLYERLLPESRWHPWIFRSLLNSAFGIYGQLDAKAARQLLGRLKLPSEFREDLDALWKQLGD